MTLDKSVNLFRLKLFHHQMDLFSAMPSAPSIYEHVLESTSLGLNMRQIIWFLVLDLLLTGWVTLGESFHLTEPLLPMCKHKVVL